MSFSKEMEQTYRADTYEQFCVNKHINNLIELEVEGICRPSNATVKVCATEISLKESKSCCGLVLKQSVFSSFTLSG